MDIVPFVVTPTGPQRTAVEAGHVRPLRIQLRQAHRAVVTVERQVLVVLVIQRGHAVDAEHRPIVQGEQILTQLQFSILLTFVTQSIFRLCTRQLETRLGTAVDRSTNAAAQVTAELQRLG
ncbi:hypothetical protein D3C71_1915020 [compost metagenome]